MLRAFFDDSGTHRQSPVVVIGGLLGTSAQWDDFEIAWTELLARSVPRRPPLKQFHLAACRGRYDEFQDYNLAERDRVTHDFRRIILDAGIVTLAIAVNGSVWDELVVGDVRYQLGEPIELCFSTCIDLLVKTARIRYPGEEVLISVDAGVEAQLAKWAHLFLSQSDRYSEIADIVFAPVSAVAALQGADMIATETYQYAQEWLRDGKENAVANAHFRGFLQREISIGLVYDREHIAETVALLRASGRAR